MGPLIGLVLLFIVLAVLNNDFIDPSNLRNLLRQVSINALIAFGMTFVILTGGIDLSVGSILALTSAVSLASAWVWSTVLLLLMAVWFHLLLHWQL